jgi:hypothetical protein
VTVRAIHGEAAVGKLRPVGPERVVRHDVEARVNTAVGKTLATLLTV